MHLCLKACQKRSQYVGECFLFLCVDWMSFLGCFFVLFRCCCFFSGGGEGGGGSGRYFTPCTTSSVFSFPSSSVSISSSFIITTIIFISSFSVRVIIISILFMYAWPEVGQHMHNFLSLTLLLSAENGGSGSAAVWDDERHQGTLPHHQWAGMNKCAFLPCHCILGKPFPAKAWWWWWWSLLYSAILRSRADSLCSHVIYMSDELFIVCFWISSEVVCLQRWHGWCHMKQLSRRKFCVHHTTLSLHAKWRCMHV